MTRWPWAATTIMLMLASLPRVVPASTAMTVAKLQLPIGTGTARNWNTLIELDKALNVR